jgi:hypothetical protein
MLAASILCVACVTATAANAGPPPRTVWIVLDEAAAWLFGRAAPKLEQTLPKSDPSLFIREFGEHPNLYGSGLKPPIPTPHLSPGFGAPTEDSAASASTTTTTDKTSKYGTAGALGSFSTAGGGTTYCLLLDKCKH